MDTPATTVTTARSPESRKDKAVMDMRLIWSKMAKKRAKHLRAMVCIVHDRRLHRFFVAIGYDFDDVRNRDLTDYADSAAKYLQLPTADVVTRLQAHRRYLPLAAAEFSCIEPSSEIEPDCSQEGTDDDEAVSLPRTSATECGSFVPPETETNEAAGFLQNQGLDSCISGTG